MARQETPDLTRCLDLKMEGDSGHCMAAQALELARVKVLDLTGFIRALPRPSRPIKRVPATTCASRADADDVLRLRYFPRHADTWIRWFRRTRCRWTLQSGTTIQRVLVSTTGNISATRARAWACIDVPCSANCRKRPCKTVA